MPDSKNMKWVDGFGTEAEADSKTEETPVNVVEPAANDADGWKQYRRWISKAPATRSRRNGIDPALYSWKGYRDWSDQVKRNWMKEADDE
ncbi:MAG: hypothetical protein ACR2RD_04080 [Woeseiaceae bacterium]